MHRNSKVVLILSFCLITTAVLAAGRCVPCKLNHYCVDGLRYQCPSTAPVTQSTGAGALSECLTCVQRNGNSANPIYDDLVGDCVSCYEYDSSTPFWDGTNCVACAGATTWDINTQSCVSSIVCSDSEDCVYKVPHTVDGVATTLYVVDATTSEDCASAIEYCDSIGARIITAAETESLALEVFYSLDDSSNIKNEEMYNWITDGKMKTWAAGVCDLDSEMATTCIWSNDWGTDYHFGCSADTADGTRRTLCVK